jgi:hypothetical protein
LVAQLLAQEELARWNCFQLVALMSVLLQLQYTLCYRSHVGRFITSVRFVRSKPSYQNSSTREIIVPTIDITNNQKKIYVCVDQLSKQAGDIMDILNVIYVLIHY